MMMSLLCCSSYSDGNVSLGTKFLISRLITLDPTKRLTAAAALEETERIISKW